MKKGKEPASKKFEEVNLSPSHTPNLLTIEDSIKKHLDVEGLGYKFINDTTLRRNYGFNKEGWKPHKFPETIRGTDPEGYLRRGDLVLASQPIGDVDMKRAIIKKRTEAYKHFNKEKANELRQLSRDGGLDMEVHEGYDENE